MFNVSLKTYSVINLMWRVIFPRFSIRPVTPRQLIYHDPFSWFQLCLCTDRATLLSSGSHHIEISCGGLPTKGDGDTKSYRLTVTAATEREIG